MTIVNVPLERITDNPFQPRQEYPGVEELAGTGHLRANGYLDLRTGSARSECIVRLGD